MTYADRLYIIQRLVDSGRLTGLLSINIFGKIDYRRFSAILEKNINWRRFWN